MAVWPDPEGIRGPRRGPLPGSRAEAGVGRTAGRVVDACDASTPRLTWPGRPPLPPSALPEPLRPRVLERHPGRGPGLGGRLVLGDNLAVGRALWDELEGRVDLVYMDPPFGTGGRFAARSRPGGEARAAYADAWPGGLAGYLEMLQPRLWLAWRLLAPHGSLYVHLDPTASHYVKVLLDEIFGPACFQREIVWRIGWISGYKGTVRNWVRNHDTILFYTKDPKVFTFHKAYVPHPPGYRRRGGGEGRGHPVDDVWNGSPADHALTGPESLDSIQIRSFSSEKTGFETQKNESLLRRIVAASSRPGDLVVDLFAGSGTTLVVAERLGRRWVGCDVSPLAVHVARKRLLGLPGRGSFAVETLGPEPGEAPEGALAWEVRPPEVALTLLDQGYDYVAVAWEAAAEGPLVPDATAQQVYRRGRPTVWVPRLAHRYAAYGVHRIVVHLGRPDGCLLRAERQVAV
jgi:hypothetical protein